MVAQLPRQTLGLEPAELLREREQNAGEIALVEDAQDQMRRCGCAPAPKTRLATIQPRSIARSTCSEKSSSAVPPLRIRSSAWLRSAASRAWSMPNARHDPVQVGIGQHQDLVEPVRELDIGVAAGPRELEGALAGRGTGADRAWCKTTSRRIPEHRRSSLRPLPEPASAPDRRRRGCAPPRAASSSSRAAPRRRAGAAAPRPRPGRARRSHSSASPTSRRTSAVSRSSAAAAGQQGEIGRQDRAAPARRRKRCWRWKLATPTTASTAEPRAGAAEPAAQRARQIEPAADELLDRTGTRRRSRTRISTRSRWPLWQPSRPAWCSLNRSGRASRSRSAGRPSPASAPTIEPEAVLLPGRSCWTCGRASAQAR